MARKYTKVAELTDVIRERKVRGETNREIGESYGLSKRQVELLINQQNRKERKIAAGYIPRPSAAFFDSEEYSKEELVAEIGAAALVNYCGLESSTSIRNNAAYIQSWLSVLRGDKRFIVSAAGKAEKAVNLILNH